MQYKFYPGLNQVVLEGHYSKSEILSIFNASRGVYLYDKNGVMTITKVVENGNERTVVKLSKKNSVIKGMEDDDQLVIVTDTSKKDEANRKKEQRALASQSRAMLKAQKQSEAQTKKQAKAQEKAKKDAAKQAAKDEKAQAKATAHAASVKEKSRVDYHRADSISKKGILSLIGDKYYDENKSAFGAVGSALSDKMKAGAVGFKKSLDPLNLVRQLTGKGVGGDWATTIAGRVMGRSEKDIDYFGGFAKRKKGGTKDPMLTTVGPADDQPLKNEEPIANILGKMYNFMYKNAEDKIRQEEIDKSFRQEQLDEDEKRHQDLVKAILGGQQPTTAKAEPAGKKGIFENIKDLFNTFMDSPMMKWIMESWTKLREFMSGGVWAALASGWSAIASTLAGMILPMLGAAAPVAALGAASYYAENADIADKENKTYNPFTAAGRAGASVTNMLPEQMDQYKKDQYQAVPEEDLAGRPAFFNMTRRRSEFDARKQKIEKSFELGTSYSKNDADRIKKAYGIDVPVQNIDMPKQVTPTSDVKTVPQQTSSSASNQPAKQQSKVQQVQKNLPQIQPMPEPSTTEAQPIVQMNNTTNNVGGKSSKVVSTTTPKQRNSDLDYYNDGIMPSW